MSFPQKIIFLKIIWRKFAHCFWNLLHDVCGNGSESFLSKCLHGGKFYCLAGRRDLVRKLRSVVHAARYGTSENVPLARAALWRPSIASESHFLMLRNDINDIFNNHAAA